MRRVWGVQNWPKRRKLLALTTSWWYLCWLLVVSPPRQLLRCYKLFPLVLACTAMNGTEIKFSRPHDWIVVFLEALLVCQCVELAVVRQLIYNSQPAIGWETNSLTHIWSRRVRLWFDCGRFKWHDTGPWQTVCFLSYLLNYPCNRL